jgi:DNA-binding CsgD family transcriptional regulator
LCATLRLEMTSHRQTQPLTPAETRVAQLVARALKNREIADELGVSEASVGVHLGHVYKKLRLRSRTELALRLASGKRRNEVALMLLAAALAAVAAGAARTRSSPRMDGRHQPSSRSEP